MNICKCFFTDCFWLSFVSVVAEMVSETMIAELCKKNQSRARNADSWKTGNYSGLVEAILARSVCPLVAVSVVT